MNVTAGDGSPRCLAGATPACRKPAYHSTNGRSDGAGRRRTDSSVEVTERVAGGHTESETMPLADTVAVQDVLSEIADQLGMRVIEGPAELP